MSLSLALNTAKSSLQATQSQIAVVSRNTAGANDPAYSKKIATLVTQGGAARVTITRASDIALYTKMLSATSDAAKQQQLLGGLDKLNQTIGDTALGESPAAKIGALKLAMSQFAKSPDSAVMGKEALQAALDVAKTLNNATHQVQQVRQTTDAAIATSVAGINDTLAKFQKVNDEIKRGYAIGADISDNLDTRDSLIAKLSEDMGITVVSREGGDVALYTDSGVPLFDGTAREVSFARTTVFQPGTAGNQIFIDGTQVTGAGSPMPLGSGGLAGMVQIRDEVAVTYQAQLDDLARGLIEAFGETGPDGAAPPLAGMFGIAAGPGIPGSPAPAGLAGLIQVSDAVNPAKGGSYDLIRDGGINGVAYEQNPTGGGGDPAFSDRLYALVAAFDVNRPFEPGFGFGAEQSLTNFAAASAGWVQGLRQDASSNASYQNILLVQASEAMSNATDVNADEETARMLQLEQSFAASAKLIAIVDQMMQTLMAMVD